MKAFVVDQKGDTPWMLRHQGVLCLDDLEFSLITCPPYGTSTDFINRFLTLYRECFWTAELQQAVLLPILRELVHPGRAAALRDVVDRIRLRDKSPTGKAAADRLESVSLAYPRLYESTTNRWSELHETSLYCPVKGAQTPATRFVTSHLIVERFAYLQHRHLRDQIHTTIFLDEAQTSLSKRAQTISGLPPTLVQLLPVTRENGMQFIVATPSWTELDPLVLAQFQVQVALQPSDGRELDAITKSFRLTPGQAKFAGGMPRGTGIGKVRGIEQPFLFTYAPFTQSKDIDVPTRAAAGERAIHFGVAPNTWAAREGHESNEQPTPSHESAPSSSPPSRVAPVVETPPRAIPLNEHATALLHDVAKHPCTLTTPSYCRCSLRLSEGDRAKSLLTNLGFVESHRVRTGRGRGKTGSALRLTPAGWQRLGQRPQKGLRGGSSVQHEFLIRQLAAHIAPSTIETLGADLVLSFNAAAHEQFRRTIEDLSGRVIALNDGDLASVEVECSRPEATGVRSAERGESFALTVLAVFGKDDKLRANVASSDHLVIVDVLLLLDALRAEAS